MGPFAFGFGRGRGRPVVVRPLFLDVIFASAEFDDVRLGNTQMFEKFPGRVW